MRSRRGASVAPYAKGYSCAQCMRESSVFFLATLSK